MTSETSREVVEHFRALGISDYIAKPFSGKALIERISQHINLKEGKHARIPHTPKLFAPTVPAPQAKTSNPQIPKASAISLCTIRVFTTKIESDMTEKSEEEHTLHEIISKYQVFLAAKSTYLTSVLVELLKEGKVRVDSDKFSERIQLKHDTNKIDPATAASLLAGFFEEQRLESQVDANATQRIVLHRPPAKPRPCA
jgi:hypothetical protein